VSVCCKICDVRDLETAVQCADLGAELIGIHCIDGLKPERAEHLRDVARELPKTRPNVGVVLVTRLVDLGVIAQLVAELGPTHIQLHSGSWTFNDIALLRGSIAAALGAVKLVTVTTPAESNERTTELCQAGDMVLVDAGYWDGGERPRWGPDDYLTPVTLARKAGRLVFIAGGLTPVNVADFVGRLRPDGVDVQSGVELSRGVKDMKKVREFVRAARGRAELDEG
jgi:phosphoribosylanthranilate isomerase